MPLLKPPEPMMAERRVRRAYRRALGTDHGALRRGPWHRQPRSRRGTSFAVNLPTRYALQVLVGAAPGITTEANPVEGHIQKHSPGRRCTLIQCAVASKGLVTYLLACATAIALSFRSPLLAVCGYRVVADDQFLKANLPGYAEHTEHVPAGLPFMRSA